MKDRFAIIDIGSNNVLLLIAEADEYNERTLYRESRISELSKGMYDRILTPEGITNTAEIIKDYLETAMRYHAKPVLIATSASREALNFKDLQDSLWQFSDERIKVISGEQEDFYNGLAHIYEFIADSKLLFDLGGGSTEFTLIENYQIKETVSVELGIRRLSNQFGYEAWKQTDHIKDLLNNVRTKTTKGTVFIGIGGTVTSLAAILLGMQEYSAEDVHGTILRKDDLDKLFVKIHEMPPEKVPDLIPFNPISKALLLSGLNIIREIIAHFKAPHIFVSDRTWQYGVLQELSRELSK